MVIKACFVIVKDYADLYLASLNINVLYKKEEILILTAFFDQLFSILNTLKTDDCIYDKFVSIVVKNELAYAAVTEVKKT